MPKTKYGTIIYLQSFNKEDFEKPFGQSNPDKKKNNGMWKE